MAAYDKLLGDIDIIPLKSLAHAIEVTNVLSGPTSPIVNILTAVAKETDLLAEPEGAAALDGAAGAAGVVGGAVAARRLSPTGRLFLDAMAKAETASGRPPPPPPGAYVADRFAWLHDLVTRQEEQPSGLERLITLLEEVTKDLNNLRDNTGTPGAGSPALARFQEAAKNLPGPMERWSQQIAVGSSGVAAGNTRAGIDGLWQASVLPFCTQATKNVYPFNRSAKAEIALQDFTRLFAPRGMLDTFFAENLSQLVDVRTRPWTFKKVNDTDLGISDAVLKQFENAAAIRDAFFPGTASPKWEFEITPFALDPSAQLVILEIDGQQIGLRQGDGQPRPVRVTWPGAVSTARLSLLPPSPTSESELVRDGAWAWFKMLDSVQKRDQTGTGRQIIFHVGGRLATFNLQLGSVQNPFTLPALSDFQCPASF